MKEIFKTICVFFIFICFVHVLDMRAEHLSSQKYGTLDLISYDMQDESLIMFILKEKLEFVVFFIIMSSLFIGVFYMLSKEGD
jgi:hypothetical protein